MTGMADRASGVKIWTRWVLAGVGVVLFLWAGFPSLDSSPNAESPIPSLGDLEPALVPTLGQWGLLLLALVMMGVAFWVIRRNSAS